MRISIRLRRTLAFLPFLVLLASCVPARNSTVEIRGVASEASAEVNEPSDEACPLCPINENAGTEGDSVASASSTPLIPHLSSEWIPVERRLRIRNWDVLFKDQDDRPGVIRDFADKPILITFFYTRCQNSAKCSAAMSRLAALQRTLERSGIQQQVRLVAITYEPQFDTPDRIKRYGLDRGLRFDQCALGIQLQQDQHQKFVDELEPPVNYNAGWVNTHGVQLTLIDARGCLVKKYHTVLWDNEEVTRDVERVLKEI